MAWRIEISSGAQKELRALDSRVSARILRFLDDKLAPLQDPRSLGEALKGPILGRFWKYRVGDYRIIASLEDDLMLILVVRIGNRREVYRR